MIVTDWYSFLRYFGQVQGRNQTIKALYRQNRRDKTDCIDIEDTDKKV